ncbi:MAG: rRNA maturation RNase YbeY [Tahibacter sp.]
MSLLLHLSRGAGLSPRGLPQRASFESWIAAALSMARYRRAAELSLRLVDDIEGRDLNQRYRQRDYATNVLSFPADLPVGVKLPLLGDLVICTMVVEREAGEQEKSVRDHYAHLTIHGVLHLLGHDHEIDADAERMEALERKALATLGITDPYRTA